jgi:hypothetical protein
MELLSMAPMQAEPKTQMGQAALVVWQRRPQLRQKKARYTLTQQTSIFMAGMALSGSNWINPPNSFYYEKEINIIGFNFFVSYGLIVCQ